MRSSLFITLSVVFHVVCVTALAIGHFKKQSGDLTVEAIAIEGGQNGSSTVETVVVEPDPVKAAPKKAASSAKKAKVAEPITELPAKVSQPESLDPQIEDSETVAVVTQEQPTQETQSEADVSEKDVHTEAVSQDVQASEKDQAPVAVTEASSPEATTAEATTTEAPAAEATATEGTSAEASPSASPSEGTAGSSKAAAISYLDLRQAAGNKGPAYPLKARVEKRQGTVGLIYRVTKEGLVQDIQIAQSSGYSDLDEAALKAIAKYRYVPGQEGWARHPVLFSLKGVQETMPSRLRSTGAQTE